MTPEPPKILSLLLPFSRLLCEPPITMNAMRRLTFVALALVLATCNGFHVSPATSFVRSATAARHQATQTHHVPSPSSSRAFSAAGAQRAKIVDRNNIALLCCCMRHRNGASPKLRVRESCLTNPGSCVDTCSSIVCTEVGYQPGSVAPCTSKDTKTGASLRLFPPSWVCAGERHNAVRRGTNGRTASLCMSLFMMPLPSFRGLRVWRGVPGCII